MRRAPCTTETRGNCNKTSHRDSKSYYLTLYLFKLNTVEMQEFSFHQDPKYITAVKELRKDYLADLQENRKGDTKSDVLRNMLIKETALDFNSFRKAVKSLTKSQSLSINEDKSNGRSIEAILTQGNHLAYIRSFSRYISLI